MDIKALQRAERGFLKRYPGGFDHPDMAAMAKKHKMAQHEAFARERFAKARFEDPEAIVADMATMVSRSSMVSMFEKPKFKRMASNLSRKDTATLAAGLQALLHGGQKGGFETVVDALRKEGLAKWTLVTVIPSYYRSNKEVFVKPSTTKLIIDKLDLDLEYSSAPSWSFYRDFRKAINEMRKKVDGSLSPSNAAFCGFLMTELRD